MSYFEDLEDELEGHMYGYLAKSRSWFRLDGCLGLILVAIFVYTQVVVVHLGHSLSSSSSVSVNPLMSLVLKLSTGSTRFLQCFGIIGLYWWRLANPIDREEIDW